MSSGSQKASHGPATNTHTHPMCTKHTSFMQEHLDDLPGSRFCLQQDRLPSSERLHASVSSPTYWSSFLPPWIHCFSRYS